MITRIAKRDKLWNILSPITSTSTKPETDWDKPSEDRQERLMYILTMSIWPNLYDVLINFQEPTALWDSMYWSFKNANDSKKFDLKNHFGLIVFSKALGVENYFSQFCQILAELSPIGVLIDDPDLV